jgi:hypothetical protein
VLDSEVRREGRGVCNEGSMEGDVGCMELVR